MKMLKPKSLHRFLGAALIMVATLTFAHGFCCGTDSDHAGESAEVCVCLCHSVIITDERCSHVPEPVPDFCNHRLIDEKPSRSAFVDGIDHPPKI